MAISENMFLLDPKFEGTLQQQLQQMITAGILKGRFRPGERLPSSRKLARHLGISRITVTLVYTELVANDYLEARDRSGYFVSQTAPRFPKLQKAQVEGSGDQIEWSRVFGHRYSGYSSFARPVDWRRLHYPFIYGQVDDSLFDHRSWRFCAIRALGRKDHPELTLDQYERDDPMLIDQILHRILPRRGITARPDEVLLTLGAQNALWMTAQLLLNQRRTAVTEDPCYPGTREILQQTRCNLRASAVDDGGLVLDGLDDRVDALFVTPSHQAPTGATMPLSRRQELLTMAHKHEFMIVEDDYDFEMSLSRSPSPALKSLDAEGRVIYIGSFSKSIFPGLRLGYVVAPEPFIREARALRALVLRHPPGHIQRTVAYFLSLGHHDAQINRMDQAYKRRRSEMEAAISQFGLKIAGEGASGGSSFWMQAPPGVNTTELARKLYSQSVLIEPGRSFFSTEDQNDDYYRIAYSSITSRRIMPGLELVRQELHRSGHMAM